MDIRSLQLLQQIFQSPAVGETRSAPAAQSSGQEATGASVQLPADEASLTHGGSLVGRALALPDARLDKVAAIQQAVADGSYEVSSSAVAESLIQHMLGR